MELTRLDFPVFTRILFLPIIPRTLTKSILEPSLLRKWLLPLLPIPLTTADSEELWVTYTNSSSLLFPIIGDNFTFSWSVLSRVQMNWFLSYRLVALASVSSSSPRVPPTKPSETVPVEAVLRFPFRILQKESASPWQTNHWRWPSQLTITSPLLVLSTASSDSLVGW